MTIKEGDKVTLINKGKRQYTVHAMTDEGDLLLEYRYLGKYLRKVIVNISSVKEVIGGKN